jgi:hypothetical protein
MAGDHARRIEMVSRSEMHHDPRPSPHRRDQRIAGPPRFLRALTSAIVLAEQVSCLVGHGQDHAGVVAARWNPLPQRVLGLLRLRARRSPARRGHDNDEGVFGCMTLLGREDVCPKQLPLQTQLAFLRRRMARAGA